MPQPCCGILLTWRPQRLCGAGHFGMSMLSLTCRMLIEVCVVRLLDMPAICFYWLACVRSEQPTLSSRSIQSVNLCNPYQAMSDECQKEDVSTDPFCKVVGLRCCQSDMAKYATSPKWWLQMPACPVPESRPCPE